MKTTSLLSVLILANCLFGQQEKEPSTRTSTDLSSSSKVYPVTPYVSFDDYAALVNKVKPHREAHLVDYTTFEQMAKEPNTVILDTRSTEMYQAKHVKGAIHLNFSDFTQENLELLIPDKNTRILIYCNNNFDDDERYFMTKSYTPPSKKLKEITMALNIPTYINLFGYGYENVYELNSLISVFLNPKMFEGTAVAE